MSYNYCIIITGPTAVGKTDASLEIAQRCQGEIINGDMGQCYAPIAIGTAKPAWKDAAIKHHLFDVLETPRSYNVVEYRALVAQTVQDILSRGKTPIIVGGSGFYLRSLLFSIAPETTAQDQKTKLSYDHETTLELWQRLHAIDPERAAKIHQNDRYRLERALDLWQMTGAKPSSLRPVWDPLVPRIQYISLYRDKQDLHDRITVRTREMCEAGWLEEVAALDASWKDFIYRKKIIGYPEMIDFLALQDYSISAREALIAEIIRKTKSYAKRQLTFNTSLMRDIKQYRTQDTHMTIEHINLTISDVNLYIKAL